MIADQQQIQRAPHLAKISVNVTDERKKCGLFSVKQVLYLIMFLWCYFTNSGKLNFVERRVSQGHTITIVSRAALIQMISYTSSSFVTKE